MTVLWCESFKHERVDDHVDEVLFVQPVVVSGCHILDEDEDLQLESLHFRGITDPSSFPVRIFARDLQSLSGRFSQLCASFIYQESAEGLLPIQPTFTDHLVIRGNYRALSLVVYGTRVDGTTLAGGSLATQYSPFAAIHSVPCGLLHGLQSGQYAANITPLRSLRLIDGRRGISRDGLLALRRTVQSWHSSGGTCVPPVDALLLAADGAGRENGRHQGRVTSPVKEDDHDDDDFLEENGELAVPDEEAEAIVHMSVSWIQEGLLPNSTASPGCSSLDRVLAGVAAAQLICCEPSLCYRWVAASGLHWLGSVLLHSRTGPAALQLAALRAIERASRHGFSCEVLLSWWQPGPDGCGVPSKPGPSMLYETLVSLLLRPQLRAIGLLTASITRRLRAYELSASLQRAVEVVVAQWYSEQAGIDVNGAVAVITTDDVSGSLQAAASALRNLVDVVVSNDSEVSDWPVALSHPSSAREIDAASGIPMPSKTFPGPSGGGKAVSFAQTIDVQFLQLLLERRTLPLLAMLYTAPELPHLQGQAAVAAIALLRATYALLLPLLNCPTGLVFLALQGPAIAAITGALSRAAKEGDEDEEQKRRWTWLPHRWTLSLAVGGYLCSPRQLSNSLSLAVAAVSALDQWLGSAHGSRESLVSLHGLASLCANTAGQQALIASLHLPQAWKALMRALPFSPDTPRTPGDATGGALVEAQYAIVLLNSLVLDASAASFNVWLPRCSTLHAIAQHWMPTLESSPPILGTQSTVVKLAEIQDAAEVGAIWQKRGGLGLVQLVATLSGTPGAKTEGTTTDSLETAVSNPTGTTTGGGSGGGPGTGAGGAAGAGGGADGKGTDGTSAAAGAAALSALLSSGTVKLPTALCLLVPLMNHGATATALYTEDVVGVMQHILGQCASALLTLSPANGLAGDTLEDASDACTTKERQILNIVLPALLILLAALRRLQMAGSLYRSTKLVEVLIRLHSALSSSPDYHLTVPPGDPSGNSTIMAAVQHALASVLAAWPVAGFSPPLLPRLLAQGSNSEVVSNSWQSVTASALFSLLGDMLPECRSSSSGGGGGGCAETVEEALWVHATGSLLGPGTVCELGWHTKTPQLQQQLVRSLAPHAEALAAVLLRLLPLKSEVVHKRMARFIMRLATADAEVAVAVVRPVVDLLQRKVVAGIEQPPSADDDDDDKGGAQSASALWEMLQALNFLIPLALYGASKASLLQTAVVPTLVRFVGKLALEKAQASRWQKHVLVSLSVLRALCNPGIALNPRNSFARRVMEDCPKHSECFEVAKALLRALHVVEAGSTLDALLRVLLNLASHDLGRAALASAAASSSMQQARAHSAAVVAASKPTEAEEQQEEVPRTPLLTLWHHIASSSALHSSSSGGGGGKGLESPRIRSAISRSSSSVRTCLFTARACIALAQKGLSDAGVTALCTLVGADTSAQRNMEFPILDVLQSVRSHLATIATATASSEAPKNVLAAETCEAVDSLITLIQSAPKREASGPSLEDLAKALLVKLPTPRPLAERKQAAPATKSDSTLGPLADSALWLQLDSEMSSSSSSSAAAKRMMLRAPSSSLSSAACDDAIPADVPWECKFPLPNMSDAAAGAAAKRKLPPGATDPAARPDLKRPRGDSGPPAPDLVPSSSSGMPPPAAAAAAAAPMAGAGGPPPPPPHLAMHHRRDNFRQRKPNTSRPTSMHVDDYQARERGAGGGGGDASIPAGPPPRSLGGGGRPPSIHVDEFMKREKHVVVGAPTSTTATSTPATAASPQPTPAPAAAVPTPSHHHQAPAPSSSAKATTPPPASRTSLPTQSSATLSEPSAPAAPLPPSRPKEEHVAQSTATSTTTTTATIAQTPITSVPRPSTMMTTTTTAAPATSQTPPALAGSQPPVPTAPRPPLPADTPPPPQPLAAMAPSPAPMPRMPPPTQRPPHMGGVGPGWGPMPPPVGADGAYLPPQPGLRPPPAPMWVNMDHHHHHHLHHPAAAGPMLPHMGGGAPPLPPAPSHIPPPPPPRPEFARPPRQATWEYHHHPPAAVQGGPTPPPPSPHPHSMDMQGVMRPPPQYMPQPDFSMAARPAAPGMPFPMGPPPPLPYQQQQQQAPYPPPLLPQGAVVGMEAPAPVLMMEPSAPPAHHHHVVVSVAATAVPPFVGIMPPPPAPAPPASLAPPPAPVKQPAEPTPPPPATTTAPPAAAAAAPAAEDDDAAEFQQLFSSPEAIKALIADQAKLAQLLQEHPKIMTMLQAKLSGGAT